MNPITKFADLLYAFLGRRSTIDFVPKEAFTFGMLLSTSFLILAWPCWLAAQTQTVQVVLPLVNFSGRAMDTEGKPVSGIAGVTSRFTKPNTPLAYFLRKSLSLIVATITSSLRTLPTFEKQN